MSTSLKERMTKTRVKTLKRSPFFGTLLLNAPWREDKNIPTVATDGKGIRFNPDFVEKLSEGEFNGVVLHEVLHCALLHVPRMKDLFKSDPNTANIAADIVVNGIIYDNNLELPKGVVTDDKLKHLSVREIYSILKQKQSKDPNYLKNKYGASDVNQCLQDPGNEKDSSGNKKESFTDQDGNEVEAPDWKDAMNKAATIARMKKAGPAGAAMERLFKELLEPTVDWRTILYKYLTEARNDFEGYDRRFMYDNLYLDDFSGSKVSALVYIDVSGSISEDIVTEFMSEVMGAVNSVNEMTGKVYCFDTNLHYVCDIQEIETDFKLIGGGGTCFECIFKGIEDYKSENMSSDSSTILPIILTDGYADLSVIPPLPALLWVISPGGVDSKDFPHGDVVRISE
jgi:predicted metal-dependent peptidase